jgi:uncharacterized membrane protein
MAGSDLLDEPDRHGYNDQPPGRFDSLPVATGGDRGEEREPYMSRTTFSDDFRRNFLTGLAAFFPVIITLFLMTWLYRAIDSTLGVGANAVCRQLIARPKAVFELAFPGHGLANVDDMGVRLAFAQAHFPRFIGTFFGLVTLAVVIYLVGSMVRGYIGGRVVRAVDRFFERFPVIKAVYPHARQVGDLLFGQTEQRRFSRVVAVQYPRSGVYSVGFVTGDGMPAVEESAGRKLVTVFVPTSPTPLTGFIVQLPPDEVVSLDMSVDEAFRYFITAGMLKSGKRRSGALPVGNGDIEQRKPGAAGDDQEGVPPGADGA